MKTIIQLLCLTSGCLSLRCGVTQTKAQSFLTNGLVAYYPFNGNANDISGNGNNGTVHGATLTANRFGTSNSAYYFAGDGSSYISIPDSPSLDISNSVTLSLWMQTGGGGSGQPFIAGKYNYYLRFNDTSSSPQFNFVIQPFVGVVFSPPISLNPNDWISVVGTYDGQSIIIYTNGLLAGQLNVIGTIGNKNQEFRIGENPDDGFDYFLGSISDVRVYNRAFSSNEVAQLYAYETSPLIGLVKAVKPSFSYLSIGTNYQMQVSSDLINWTNQGAVFPATNSSMIYPQYFDVNNFNSLYFRLQVSP